MVGRINKFIRSRIFQELLFCSISFFVLLRLFARGGQPRQIDFIYTSLFHIPLLIAVFVNSLVLVPKTLSNGKYFKYLALLTALYGLTYVCYTFTFNYLSDWIFPGFYFIAIYNPLEMLGFFVIYVGITSLIEFSKSWFREIEMEKQMESLKKQKVETELKALRAQINPHFLFNSLNHIYSLANLQSPDTAPAILQLSDLLRYTLRQLDKDNVPLKDELNYLEKYVDLYKSRMQHPQKVHFRVNGSVDGLSIAPLMLIAFVENCFKHGSVDQPDETIDIKIEMDSGRLLLETRNNTATKTALPKEAGGVGLDNVRRRLNLLYPDKYTLDIASRENIFTAKLELKLI